MEGVVYAGFGSHCDSLPYQGWLVGVSTSTAQVRTMWATGPLGSAIWQGGGGLVSDGPGQILFATGNSFEPTPPDSPTPPEDLGEAVARVQIEPTGKAKATDFFSPYNRQELDEHDRDLGSSAPTALPSQYFGTKAVPDLMLVAGKERRIFVLDRDHLGGQGQGPGGTDDILGEILLPPTSDPLAYGSGSPIVTSKGTTPGSAIVWEEQCPQGWPCAGSTLNAYKAVPAEGEPPLWRAPIGVASKFGRPGVADGRVYVGTMDERVIGFGVPSEPPPNEEGTGGGQGGANQGSSSQGPPAGPGPGTSTVTPPWTKLKTISIHGAAGRATFRFASEVGADFECRFQRVPNRDAHSPAPARFRPCASPQTYRHLARGRYRFQVRAVNAAGPDRSPAGHRFTLP